MTERDRFFEVRLPGWLAAAAAWLVLACPGVAPAAGDLTPAEVRQMSRFDVSTAGPQDVKEARALFAGRGPDVARYFLTHTDMPRANGAYFFVLQALADTDTALVLIRALGDPPKIVSGFVVKPGDSTSILNRDILEVFVAIEGVLVNDSVRSDPRTVAALVEAIARLRAKPWDPHYAGMAVTLLGRCAGPEAVAALQKLAADPDTAIRSLALEGLGHAASAAVNVNSNREQPGRAAEDEKKDQSSALPAIARALGANLDPRARAKAATALGNLGSADGVPPLRDALARERHPQVVDAIVLALQKLGAPLTDPQSCREVVGRTWEPAAARFPFACWRASASREAVIEAATRGPTQLRALALYSLVERAVYATEPPVVALAPPPMAAPPAPPGATAVTNVPIPPPESSRVSFGEATRKRLLASAAETLSRPITTSPGKGEGISDETAQLVYDAMWEISGRNMATALAYADRISPPLAARHADAGRYWASYYLENKDRSAYLDYRRPRQAAVAIMLALAFGILLAWQKTRRAAVTLVLAALGWSVSSFFETSMRELPPPPLQFLTVTAIAFLSAGFSVAGMALWKSRATGTALRAIGRAVASITVAAVLAFAVCVFVHGAFFPGAGGGWELIFDPLGSVVIAVPVAVALAFVDGIFLRRLLGEEG